MTKNTIRKCGYPHCKHGGGVDIAKDDYEKIGNKYYHKECILEKEDMQCIYNTWKDRINPESPMSQIRMILSNYVHKVNYAPEYVLFVINYVADHGLRLQHPPGLKYYLEKPQIKEAFEAQKYKICHEEDFEVEIPEYEIVENAQKPKRLSFEEIIRRKKKKERLNCAV